VLATRRRKRKRKESPPNVLRKGPPSTQSTHPFPPMQFQVLFNSIFKVLFSFPSLYFCTIGLPIIFSLRRDLSPVFGLQSQTTLLFRTTATGDLFSNSSNTGYLLIFVVLGRSESFPFFYARSKACTVHSVQTTIREVRSTTSRFSYGLYSLHSLLLGVSLLVSFPPVSNMLKFTGSS